MDFNEFQKKALKSAIYPDKGNNIVYPALGLTGEAGEVAEKVKKIIRDDNGAISDEKRELLKKELGDVLWYTAAMAYELKIDLNDVAKDNIDKLTSRLKRGKIKGSGDLR